MYLIINNNRHTVSRRLVTNDTIKYLSVEPAPQDVTGTISMYRNDGALMSEDNADSFERQTYVGTVFTLTNKPEPQPMPEPEPRESIEDIVDTLLGVGV